MSSVDLLTLWGVEPGGYDAAATWAACRGGNLLRVPIGIDDVRNSIHLDLSSRRYGMGAHGVCVGPTGSGKTELVKTIVLSFAISNPPDDVAVLLVDLATRMTFSDLQRLPHVAGIFGATDSYSPVASDLTNPLQAELGRRRDALRAAGNLGSITTYQRLRETRSSLEPLPRLIVVIEDCSSLLAQWPHFAETLGIIGRLGESYGVHLLLTSGRPDDPRLRPVEPFVTYRFALTTSQHPGLGQVLDLRSGLSDRFQAAAVTPAATGTSGETETRHQDTLSVTIDRMVETGVAATRRIL